MPEISQLKTFSTQTLVLTYLTEQGYKIKKSALSNHVRTGLLRKKNGVFSQKDVDAYGLLHLQEDATGEKDSGKKGRKLQEQKLRKDIALKNEALLKAIMEREIMEGKYVLRHKVEQELVARGLVLQEGQRHTIHTYVAEWCDEVNGDHALLGFLEETMIKAFEQLLHDYAALDSFKIIFRENSNA